MNEIINILSTACAAVVLVIYQPLYLFKQWILRRRTLLTDAIHKVLTCAKCAGLTLALLLSVSIEKFNVWSYTLYYPTISKEEILLACLISILAEAIYRWISTIKIN